MHQLAVLLAVADRLAIISVKYFDGRPEPNNLVISKFPLAASFALPSTSTLLTPLGGIQTSFAVMNVRTARLT